MTFVRISCYPVNRIGQSFDVRDYLRHALFIQLSYASLPAGVDAGQTFEISFGNINALRRGRITNEASKDSAALRIEEKRKESPASLPAPFLSKYEVNRIRNDYSVRKNVRQKMARIRGGTEPP